MDGGWHRPAAVHGPASDLLRDAAGPALFAAIVAILATVAIERFGGRLGGVLGSMPTTIVPASLGIWAGSADEAAFAAAMAAVPPGMVVNAFFLWTWRVGPARLPDRSLGARLGVMTALSLSAWAVGAAVLVVAMGALRDVGVPPLAVGAAAFALQLSVGAWACWQAPPSPRGGRRVSAGALALRGALAGAAIAVSVGVASTGLDLLAGMASVFPAIFLTTMVGLWLAQGEAVPVGAVGPMMLGSGAVSAFALLASVAFPALGPGLGATVTWGAAVLAVSAPAAWWLMRARAAQAPAG